MSTVPRAVPAPDTPALLRRAAEIIEAKGLAKFHMVTLDGKVDLYKALDEAMFEQAGITAGHPEAPWFVDGARSAVIDELERRDEPLAWYPALWQDGDEVSSQDVADVLRSAAGAVS